MVKAIEERTEADRPKAWPTFCDTSPADLADPSQGDLSMRDIETFRGKNPVPGSVAEFILNTFNIPMEYDTSGGGPLEGIDLKHADAITTLKLSLIEEFGKIGNNYATTYLKEPIVNEDGKVEFVEIGKRNANFSPYILHTIPSKAFDNKDTTVLITGRKPLPLRKQGEWYDLLQSDSIDQGVVKGNGAVLWDTHSMVSNCNKDMFSGHATITFRNPHFSSTDYKDGISTIYDMNVDRSPFEKIIGWAWTIEPPEEWVTPETNVSYKRQCSVPIEISRPNNDGSPEYVMRENAGPLEMADRFDSTKKPQIGKLYKRMYNADFDQNSGVDVSCMDGLGTELEDSEFTGTYGNGQLTKGVVVKIPDALRYETIRNTTVDAFTRISKVYVVGLMLDVCFGKPKVGIGLDRLASRNPEDRDVLVSANNLKEVTVALTEGVHYVVGYIVDPQDLLRKKPYIRFANNSDVNDFAEYGTGVDGNGVDFIIVAGSSWHTNLILGGSGEKDLGFCSINVDAYRNLITGKGAILPLNSQSAILVDQVYAVVDLDTDCLVVTDPNGIIEHDDGSKEGRARRIIIETKAMVSAITMDDPPPPMAVAYAGVNKVIDQTVNFRDSDPTTTQDLEATEVEEVYTYMDAGSRSVNINMASLEEDEIKKMAQTIYEYIEEDEGIEVTYVCGPNCTAKLGDRGYAGGVINNITYSYSDQGSYTISVNEGPRVLGEGSGLANIVGNVYIKATENISKEATVIQDVGNHIAYKVLIDGVGVREAINGCPELIRVGDKVNVTINNNPVEI